MGRYTRPFLFLIVFPLYHESIVLSFSFGFIVYVLFDGWYTYRVKVLDNVRYFIGNCTQNNRNANNRVYGEAH